MKEGYVIPVREKVAYGIGDTAINTAYGAIGFYMLWFIVNVGGISPGKAGLVFMLARAWDAITDYLMGRISDRTTSRWGRRRPYLFFGAIPMGACFAILWLVPDTSETWRFIFYLFVFILFNTAFTVVSVPYGSLMAEMTQNYDERISLSGFRIGFSFVGTLLGAAGVTLIVDVIFSTAGKEKGFTYMGIIFGILIVICLFITALSTRERVSHIEQVYEGFFQTLGSFFKLREFRIVMGLFLCNMIGLDIIMAVFFFFLGDALQIEGDVTVYMAIPLVIAILAAPLWIFLGNRWGKRKAYMVSAVYFTVMLLFSLFIPVKQVTLTLIICVFAGVGISASQIIPWSILPDVIEVDEHKNHVRREGAFFGISTFLYKVASAVAIAGIGLVLEIFGYIKASPDEAVAAAQQIVQPDSALMAVRGLFGLAPGIFFVLSAVFAYRLPITRERFNQIKAELENRKSSG